MYVKVFADLLDSSLWAEDSDTRIVWLTLLLMADSDGMVRSTAPGIARRANIDVTVTRVTLERFEAPDPESRTSEHEGRRLERVEGGYLILNYLKYRELKSQDQQREGVRRRVAAWRERRRASGNGPVTSGNAGNDKQKQIQIQMEEESPLPPLADVTDERRKAAAAEVGSFNGYPAHTILREIGRMEAAGIKVDVARRLIEEGMPLAPWKVADREIRKLEGERKRRQRDDALRRELEERNRSNAEGDKTRQANTQREAALRARYEALVPAFEAMPRDERERIDREAPTGATASALERGTAMWLTIVGERWMGMVEQRAAAPARAGPV